MHNLLIKLPYLCVMLLGLTAASVDARPTSAAELVIVEVEETTGIRRFQYPVATQITLKEPVPIETDFRLLLDGKPVLAQFRPAEEGDAVSQWWLDFPVNLLPYQTLAYSVAFGADLPAAPKPKRGHKLIRSEYAFEVINEPAIAWSVDRELSTLPASVRSGELQYLLPCSHGLMMFDDSGTSHIGGRGITPHVTRSGPLAVGLRFDNVEEGPIHNRIRSSVDLTFPVFKSWVEVDWRVDDPQGKISVLAAHWNLNLNKATRDEPTLVDFGASSLVYVALRDGQSALLRSGPFATGAQQANENKPCAWEVLRGAEPFVSGPRRHSTETRPEGWAHVMDRERCLAIAVDDFAQDTSDEISISDNGDLLLKRAYLAQPEEPNATSKRLHFWLHFIPFPPQQTAATSPQSMQNPPTVRIRRSAT